MGEDGPKFKSRAEIDSEYRRVAAYLPSLLLYLRNVRNIKIPEAHQMSASCDKIMENVEKGALPKPDALAELNKMAARLNKYALDQNIPEEEIAEDRMISYGDIELAQIDAEERYPDIDFKNLRKM